MRKYLTRHCNGSSKTPDRGSLDHLFVSVQTFNSQKEFFRSRLSTVKTRADLIIESLHHYLADPHRCKALCFCTSREHAIFMSEQLQKAGFRSTYLISGGNRNNEQERRDIHQQLKAGSINWELTEALPSGLFKTAEKMAAR